MFHVAVLQLCVFYKSIPCSQDTQVFLTGYLTRKHMQGELKLQKVSKLNFNLDVLALEYSPLPLTLQHIALLDDLKNRKTYHDKR